MDKTHQPTDRGLTLREATQDFLSGALPEEVLAKAETDDESARTTVKMMRAFQEGAFWACWRLHLELSKEKPEILDVMEALLAEHAAVRDISEGKRKNRMN